MTTSNQGDLFDVGPRVPPLLNKDRRAFFAPFLTPGAPYRPSNGSEGDMFQERWCYNCAHWDDATGCPIYMATMVHEKDDKDYPKDWRVGCDQQPECAAFKESDQP